MKALDIRTLVERAIGHATRAEVQRAIQDAITADEPNLRLIRQLTALDLAMEVEQTVLLPMGEKDRNLASPARLAQTYKELRCLLAKDDGEVVGDGWELLLGGEEEVDDEPVLSAVSPTGSEATQLRVTDESIVDGYCSRPTEPYPATVKEQVLLALERGVRSKSSIARDHGVSLTTVSRWHKKSLRS
jgi:hypothetical protein